MEDKLIVNRMMPNGKERVVRPFHLSLKGLESALICRDEEDYDVMVKNIALSAKRNNVIVVSYTVVSNHAHIALLAESSDNVKLFSNDLKKVQSMWLNRKYGDMHLLRNTDVNISPVETMWYARNAFAYIIRNALDNGASGISTYKWTSYRGMFCGGKASNHCFPVKCLTTRAMERILHTGENLRDVDWVLNEENGLEPVSFCDWAYLEMVYNHDQAFFMKVIGEVNVKQMKYEIDIAPRRKMSDMEFLKTANELAIMWYQKSVNELSPSGKVRFLQYLARKIYVSVPQIARCMQMERAEVADLLNQKTTIR